MIYVIYVFAGVFILLGAAMFYVFHRERHFGMFLMGLTYSISGLMAITTAHWWPLVAGFVLVWMLKMLGLEMGADEVARTPPGEEGGRNNSGGAEHRAWKARDGERKSGG